MFGQCPARIGSWLRYLWTPANPGQAGWQATGLLSAPSLSPSPPPRASQDREGRKYVSRRALAHRSHRCRRGLRGLCLRDRCSHDAPRLSVVRCPPAPVSADLARLPGCPVRPLSGMYASLSLRPSVRPHLTHLRPVRPGGCILAMPIPALRSTCSSSSSFSFAYED